MVSNIFDWGRSYEKWSSKKLLLLITFVLLLLPTNSVFASLGNTSCDGNNCLEAPTSNVNEKEFKDIWNKVKKTKEYKKLAKDSIVNSLNKDDIVINKAENGVQQVASIGFIIGNKVSSDNLAYVEILFDLEKENVLTVKKMYGELTESGLINIRMVVNDDIGFSMNINMDGEIVGENGDIISQDEFFEEVVNDMAPEFSTYGWCEWVVGALCGTGGGAGCFALAAALGITTGVGGLALASVCGLIGALGCTAATIAICG
ncbi:halocin C8-like bacteriocin domain-containing protein [Ornithinibacillus bavariensis]